MDPDELRRRIQGGEGTRLEFKQGLPSTAKVARTLAALANTRGGLLLIGVGDRGELLGAPHPDATLAEVERIAAEEIEPPVPVRVGLTRIDGSAVVWAFAPRATGSPHGIRRPGGELEWPVRVGSSTRASTGPAREALTRGPRGGSLDDLAKRILAWVERVPEGPQSDRTADAFARAHNIGRQRATRAFIRLERAGHLIGHGEGRSRAYTRP